MAVSQARFDAERDEKRQKLALKKRDLLLREREQLLAEFKAGAITIEEYRKDRGKIDAELENLSSSPSGSAADENDQLPLLSDAAVNAD